LWKRIAIILGVGFVIGFSALMAVRLITGKSLGLKSFAYEQARFVASLGRASTDSQRVKNNNRGEFTNVLFMHHSVGDALIEEGNVRSQMQAAGLDFWDHDYNQYGITDPTGTPTAYSYNVPNDNTDPDGYAAIFKQRIFGLPFNTISGMMQHEVIIFKSCFPANDINSDEKLAAYQDYYRQIAAFTDRHPEKLFIALTIPPLNPSSTNPEIAARARVFANWLKSDEYRNGHTNLYTFDLYDLLAEPNPAAPDANMLRTAYRDEDDSHPNQLANETVAPIFVAFVVQSIEEYRTRYGP
jgi:hypothetical protein